MLSAHARYEAPNTELSTVLFVAAYIIYNYSSLCDDCVVLSRTLFIFKLFASV